jgi:heme-degrading monooxygenase HmoA
MPQPHEGTTGEVMSVFCSLRAPGFEEEYEALATETERIARSLPGFVSFKTYAADDGERCSIAIFADWESEAAWRDHPVHRAAQEAGRDHLYRRYEIALCEVRERRVHEQE